MKKTHGAVVMIFMLGLFPVQTRAQSVPRPAQHPAAQLEQQRKEAEQRKNTLEEESKKQSAELASTQSALVDIGSQVRENEASLTALDKRIAENSEEQKGIRARLKKDRHSIGTLVTALERLDRMPPEAVIARPGAPLQTAQSAMLLQGILPDLYGRAESLRKDLERLDTLLAQIEQDKQAVLQTSEELARKRHEVGDLLKKRKSLYAKTQTDLKEQQEALKDISARSKNLKDLVAQIERREREERKRAEEEERTRRIAQAARDAEDKPVRTSRLRASARKTPIPRPGDAQLPVSGLIRVGYGQRDDMGQASEGLTLEGRSGGLIVAPMGGVVRYAGYFKNYGQIIIIEHQKDYHSLIAGLARIDTVVGQSVAAGEPVGALPKSSENGGAPTLYYELRRNGEPVNPSHRIAGL